MNVKQLIQKTIRSKKGYKSNYYRTVYYSKGFDNILHVIRRNSFPARSIICVSPFLKKIYSYCIRTKFEKQIVEQTLSLLGIKNIIIEYNKKLRSGDNHYLLFESRDRGLSLEYIPPKEYISEKYITSIYKIKRLKRYSSNMIAMDIPSFQKIIIFKLLVNFDVKILAFNNINVTNELDRVRLVVITLIASPLKYYYYLVNFPGLDPANSLEKVGSGKTFKHVQPVITAYLI